jgi:integrase
MTTLAVRFESKVDRSGEHHLWTGSKKADGSGKMKVDGRTVAARRVAWELQHGELPPTTDVRGCPDHKACVRVEHLSLATGNETPTITAARRSRRGGGSMTEISPGVYKLFVVAGYHDDGRPRRVVRTVRASRPQAAKALAEFVAEVGDGRGLPAPDAKSMTVDALLEQYLASCEDDSDDNPKALAHSTLVRYRDLKKNWITPVIGGVRLSKLSDEHIDRCFARMRSAGKSHSHMNNAKALLSGALRWAKRRRLVRQNPLDGFELPRSKYVAREVMPPEIDELVALLNGAAEHAPDIAPVLSLAATTGMRRGELSGLQRGKVDLKAGRLFVDRAVNDAGGEVVEKPTKTHQTRWVSLDPASVRVLSGHLRDMEKRAAQFGTVLDDNDYVFSLEADCSKPMRPEYMTRRMRQLRRVLDLGNADFDATILALRKFTSTELMDAGFNPSLVSGRQGHTVQVLLNHYSKARRSADKKAAAHLGRRVHGRTSQTGA